MTAKRARFHLIAAAIASLFCANNGLAELATVRIRLEPTDTDGKPITAVGLGDDFLVNTFVQDLRDPAATGVFASYMDLTYPDSLVSLNGGISYTAPYTNGQTGNTGVSGLVDEVGAFGGFTPPGPGEHLLFTLPFSASAIGDAIFASDPAEAVGADVLVHGLNKAVLPELVDYGTAMVSILPNDCVSDIACVCAAESGLLPGDIDGDGIVAFGDFLILSHNFGTSQAAYSAGDLDCSGAVDFADFLLLSDNFGKTRASAAAVPEPSSIMLGLGLILTAAWRRRKR